MGAWREALDALRHIAPRLARQPFPPPEFEGARSTIRRRLNQYLLVWEWYRRKPRLRSYPARLCIESTGACNLSCPHCFTGAGERGQPRSSIPLDLYRRLLAELGGYLWQVEFHNWGEPLLNRSIVTMIAEAHALGISTSLCTNFSIPFDTDRARRLVSSGLDVMGVSIDGASQEVYEQYRVGGSLDLVLQNCRLILEAKRELGMATPRVNWVYHVFAHNRDDVGPAEVLARELEMDFHASRGRVVGPDWDPEARWIAHEHVEPLPCYTLWHTAVVHSDGSVAPCRGSFYPDDDMGRVGPRPEDPTFHDVWNRERFRRARSFFTVRSGTEEDRRHICHDCPQTIDFHGFIGHVLAGGTREQWRPSISSNERYNYFWRRRPTDAAARPRQGGPAGSHVRRA